jgi:amino acid transporter
MRVADLLFGKRLETAAGRSEQVGSLSGVPILGLDALSSAAYGPEAALTLLLPLGAVSVRYIWPIMAAVIALMTVVCVSYRQTIAAYPGGGGSYTVAKENLGPSTGLVAAAALLLDYVLNVAVGISAGVGAIVSALPDLQPHTLPLCLMLLGLLTVVNLRGVRSTGAALAVPTYLFLACMAVLMSVGIAKVIAAGGHPSPVTPAPALPAATEAVSTWLVLRAFASGCTALTGVEAVSNAVPIFRAPSTHRAQRTLTAIVTVLAVLLAGVALLCRAYGVGATIPDQPGYQSVLSQVLGAVAGRGVFYGVAIASIFSILALSANTSFADFPRVCSSHSTASPTASFRCSPSALSWRSPCPRRAWCNTGGDTQARARGTRWSSTRWGPSVRQSRSSSSWFRNSWRGHGSPPPPSPSGSSFFIESIATTTVSRPRRAAAR